LSSLLKDINPFPDRLMNLIKRLFTSVIASTLLVSSSFNHVKAS